MMANGASLNSGYSCAPAACFAHTSCYPTGLDLANQIDPRQLAPRPRPRPASDGDRSDGNSDIQRLLDKQLSSDRIFRKLYSENVVDFFKWLGGERYWQDLKRYNDPEDVDAVRGFYQRRVHDVYGAQSGRRAAEHAYNSALADAIAASFNDGSAAAFDPKNMSTEQLRALNESLSTLIPREEMPEGFWAGHSRLKKAGMVAFAIAVVAALTGISGCVGQNVPQKDVWHGHADLVTPGYHSKNPDVAFGQAADQQQKALGMVTGLVPGLDLYKGGADVLKQVDKATAAGWVESFISYAQSMCVQHKPTLSDGMSHDLWDGVNYLGDLYGDGKESTYPTVDDVFGLGNLAGCYKKQLTSGVSTETAAKAKLLTYTQDRVNEIIALLLEAEYTGSITDTVTPTVTAVKTTPAATTPAVTGFPTVTPTGGATVGPTATAEKGFCDINFIKANIEQHGDLKLTGVYEGQNPLGKTAIVYIQGSPAQDFIKSNMASIKNLCPDAKVVSLHFTTDSGESCFIADRDIFQNMLVKSYETPEIIKAIYSSDCVWSQARGY